MNEPQTYIVRPRINAHNSIPIVSINVITSNFHTIIIIIIINKSNTHNLSAVSYILLYLIQKQTRLIHSSQNVSNRMPRTVQQLFIQSDLERFCFG